jgi:hypothetical protein
MDHDEALPVGGRLGAQVVAEVRHGERHRPALTRVDEALEHGDPGTHVGGDASGIGLSGARVRSG